MQEDKSTVIVEDDYIISTMWSMLLAQENIPVAGTAGDPYEAIDLIRRTRPSYILMDVMLGSDMTGVDVARIVLGEMPDTRVIFITASAEPANIALMDSLNASLVLFKPVNEDQLLGIYQ